MKLSEYLIEENESLFADVGYTYPEFLTQAVQDDIEEIAVMDFGNRRIRPYLISLTERSQGGISPELDTVIKRAVASYINRNAYRFTGMFASEGFSYDPLENYNMTETMTDDTTEVDYGKTDTRTLVKDSSDTRTYDLTDERTPDLQEQRTADLLDTHTLDNLTNTETDQMAGYNSNAFQDANKKTAVGTGAETTATTGTDTTNTTGTDTNTRTGTDTMEYAGTDTDTSVLSGKDTTTRNYTLQRYGNIGVQTSMDMLQKYRDVLDFSALFELAHGIVNAITIGVY